MGRQHRIIKRNPLIVICYEGTNETSEKVYFSNFKERNLRIQFTTGGSTDPEGMLNDLQNYIINEDLKNEDDCTIFILIDTDLDGSRIKKIKELINKAKKFEDFDIQIITTTPTFEIWYLMHYRTNNLKFNSSKEVKRALRKETNGKYNESLNLYPYIKNNQNKAYNHAKKIEELAVKNGEDIIEANPHTDIYKIIDKINEKRNRS